PAGNGAVKEEALIRSSRRSRDGKAGCHAAPRVDQPRSRCYSAPGVGSIAVKRLVSGRARGHGRFPEHND
ncbi:MAG: hypothetical protein ACXVB5_20180, partial [Isosphaeraceae bacterium]